MLAFSRVWMVWCGVLLQTWGICLVFGGFGVVWRSKRAQLIPSHIPSSVYTFSSRGPVAQWIERLPPEQKVVGSNPIKPTFDFLLSYFPYFPYLSS